MSFETWKREFYPKDADEVNDNYVDAVEHSLKKWVGLRRENLKRHNMTYAIHRWGNLKRDMDYVGIRGRHSDKSERDLNVNGDSCALCLLYEGLDGDCRACPIQKLLGKRCDEARWGEESHSPYRVFRDTGNPEPMITVLENALVKARSSS